MGKRSGWERVQKNSGGPVYFAVDQARKLHDAVLLAFFRYTKH